MDRDLFVLPTLLAGLLVLEPVFVLLTVGHGGSFEGLRGSVNRRVAYVSRHDGKAVKSL
jgi:hypothetical protein